MIVTDVNLLVYAFRLESDRHDQASQWLTRQLSADDDYALVDMVLAGFVRLVTSPRIFADPAPTAVALDFVEAIAGAPRARWIEPGSSVWRTFRSLAGNDRAVRGNLVPDAFLAAIALSHGARLATCDRGFARFGGLQFFDPLTMA